MNAKTPKPGPLTLEERPKKATPRPPLRGGRGKGRSLGAFTALRPRGHNFSGGPGALAPSVLKEAARAVFLFEETGDSILGLSHRSARFQEMVASLEAQLLTL